MGRTRASNGLFIIAILGIILVTFSVPASAAESHSTSKRDSRLSLPQAVSIALARNLRMSDARLDVQEKEYQRREAYSDFFPTVDVQYIATGNRYQQQSSIQHLPGVQTAAGQP